MKKEINFPVIGAIVAWESQAHGSWMSKIGRVTRLPVPGAKPSTSAARFEMDILAKYDTKVDSGDIIVDTKKPRSFRKVTNKKGLATINQLRTPMAWEIAEVSE